jgi:hypothetical protein
LVYEVFSAMTHVWTIDNAWVIVEHPVNELRTLFLLWVHNYLSDYPFVLVICRTTVL